MVRLNQHPDYRRPLDPVDAEMLGLKSAAEVERYLAQRQGHVETPLHHLPSLAAELGLAEIHIKDEGYRFGLGSFKALGGAYAVARLLLEEASVQLGRHVGDRGSALDRSPVDRGDHDRCLRHGRKSRSVGRAGR